MTLGRPSKRPVFLDTKALKNYNERQVLRGFGRAFQSRTGSYPAGKYFLDKQDTL